MERLHFLNRTPGTTGEMSIEFDTLSGHVRSLATGFWSMDQIRSFFVDWERAIRRIHGGGLRVSALVDMSDGQVQKADVAEYIASATTNLYIEGDAIAMLVPTSLAKMQMRRVLDARFHDFFLSRNAAETWLEGRRRDGHTIGHVAA